MRNNRAAKNQETTRRILVISIIILLLALLALLVRGISVRSCSDPEQTAKLPTDTPKVESPTPADTDVPASTVPVSEPPTAPAAPSEQPATPTPVPATPTPPPEQNPYGIPRVVTEGSMTDVLARLEQFKTLPASEKLILLDVGHGGFDPGTAGVNTGVTEADLNLIVSRLLAQRLGEKGYFVFMTRMGEYACADNKNEDMRLRTRIMRLDIFDCSVSIHMNAAGSADAHGVRLYHYKSGTEGEKLARSILQSICALTDETRTTTNTDNLMVVREPHAPAALVECGFLTNPDDEKKLIDPSYQATLALAIANGIENYLNGSN